MTPIARNRFVPILLLASALVLGGCASVLRVDNQVESVASWDSSQGVPAAPQYYLFERLPSQRKVQPPRPDRAGAMDDRQPGRTGLARGRHRRSGTGLARAGSGQQRAPALCPLGRAARRILERRGHLRQPGWLRASADVLAGRCTPTTRRPTSSDRCRWWCGMRPPAASSMRPARPTTVAGTARPSCGKPSSGLPCPNSRYRAPAVAGSTSTCRAEPAGRRSVGRQRSRTASTRSSTRSCLASTSCTPHNRACSRSSSLT
ncbi:MAG: hypothetical protein MZV70_07220 [Desulfobacterales bacterium]|nr:hypothetical protein [Desulfobacterales bacterium]